MARRIIPTPERRAPNCLPARRGVYLDAVNARTQTLPGVYTDEGFLDRPTCETIKAEMRRGVHERAKVYDRDWKHEEKAGHRSTLQVGVGDGVDALVRGKLLAARGALTRHFGVEVKDC